MLETEISQIIQRNLDTVQDEIAHACRVGGRSLGDVRLVAVTKYAQPEWLQALSMFHSVFAENRPQQLADRQAMYPDAQWHLIGQLQRNKVRLALQHTTLIHSVDSVRLLKRIASVATELRIRPRILLQINVSGEATKSGFAPAEILGAWPEIAASSKSLQIDGLMTMAPAEDDPQRARPHFRELRELKEKLLTHDGVKDSGPALPELSMGMSGDFAVAIEEGATLVRIGSRLFAGL